MADLEEMLRAAGLAGTDGSFVDPETFRSGFVTLIGRPNAGKSTLLNAVMGEKLAITSNTPQTTRHRFRAIYDSPEMQMIMVDTPGLHKPYDALSEELNTSALKALEDVDVIAMLVDCSKPVGKGDQWVAGQLREFKAKKILVISKADLGRQGQADQQLEQARRDLLAGDFAGLDRTAHALKGAALTVGDQEMLAEVLAMRDAAKASDGLNATAAADRIAALSAAL